MKGYIFEAIADLFRPAGGGFGLKEAGAWWRENGEDVRRLRMHDKALGLPCSWRQACQRHAGYDGGMTEAIAGCKAVSVVLRQFAPDAPLPAAPVSLSELQEKAAERLYAALHILLRDHRERGAAVRVAAMATVAAHDPESAIAWADSVEKAHTVRVRVKPMKRDKNAQSLEERAAEELAAELAAAKAKAEAEAS